MINPIDGNQQCDMDDLIKVVDNKTVCKACGVVTKMLYSTNKGYMCKAHAR